MQRRCRTEQVANGSRGKSFGSCGSGTCEGRGRRVRQNQPITAQDSSAMASRKRPGAMTPFYIAQCFSFLMFFLRMGRMSKL